MAEILSEESGVGRNLEEISGGQLRCQSGEALAEWRSCEQVENGLPSTSPPYWDTDDDEDCGPKPSELYGKYTWKIDKFSQINKRELRSNAFEVGGYKWYILIYPQGCDVCNHLSLFLCVADHDKLLPGWSHFAQFTIAVVNKDPKKSKYSDTLHRFWKKEHDWGWKKFMELSKVLDGFIDVDTLIIKAQVQVIRERADRPFHCLDCQYRRELVRVYLTNVEAICRRFVEERRSKLGKLIEDKARWSSFCTFWLGIDQNARCLMSREKSDAVLRIVVKHFFIEKEVTSTLVMDSLYSGLKSLEGMNKSKKCREKLLDVEELLVPIVRLEKDTFVLVDDVLLLLERAAMEPLPPKDDKGPQNRTKDGGSGEDFNKDSIEHDERRLTELGRKTIEIFALAHIFSKIEVAYQEAVALKRQEELIREEEAACLAETEQRAKRGAVEKEKKSKKKQGKQKRNGRKGKDKGRDEKPNLVVEDKLLKESAPYGRKDLTTEAEPGFEKPVTVDDVSDLSDSLDCVAEALQLDSDDRDGSPVNWDTDTFEIHSPAEASSSGIRGLSSIQNGKGERKSSSAMDDSSSTCSTDSVPSVVRNKPYRGFLQPNQKTHKSPSSRSNQRDKATRDSTGQNSEVHSQPSGTATDRAQSIDPSGSCTVESEPEAAPQTLQEQSKSPDWHFVKKEDVAYLERKLSKDQGDVERHSKEKATAGPSPPSSPTKNLSSAVQFKSEPKGNVVTDNVSAGKPSPLAGSRGVGVATPGSSKPDAQVAAVPKPTEKPSVQQVPVMSRPLSAPIIPAPKPSASVISTVQTMPLLARSVSAAGRLGPEPSTASQSYIPHSYRNAIMGASAAAISGGFPQSHTSSLAVNPPQQCYPQTHAFVPAAMFLPQSPERVQPSQVKRNLSFGVVGHEVAQNGLQWMQRDAFPLLDDVRRPEFYKPAQSRSQTEFAACTSGRQTHNAMAEEFPHLDIINDLLDEEYGIGKVANLGNGPHHLDRQFTFPGPMSMWGGNAGPSSSSCRLERTQSYRDDGLQRGGYGSLGRGHFDLLRETLHQANPRPYVNRQIDCLVPNQWQTAGSDLSVRGTRNIEADGFPYHVPEYPDLGSCCINGYQMFRPSNGH